MFLYFQLLNRRGERGWWSTRSCVSARTLSPVSLEIRTVTSLIWQSLRINYHIIGISWHQISILFYFHGIVIFLMLFWVLVTKSFFLVSALNLKLLFLSKHVKYFRSVVIFFYGSCISVQYFNLIISFLAALYCTWNMLLWDDTVLKTHLCIDEETYKWPWHLTNFN